MFFSVACNSAGKTSTPVVPVEWVIDLGGVAFVSLPIPIHDARFQLSYYDERGERQWKTSEVELFPGDVFVVYDADHQTARVFLARSPHMGCLLKWVAETKSFEDPCYGSRFSIDGAYEFGPAPRSLDELPAEVKDHMVWVKNELVYGEEHR
jgi:Rieske Fe-S protein